MEKFTFLKSEDGEIFILKKDYPGFLCRVNTIIPFDISIIISDLLDKRRFNKKTMYKYESIHSFCFAVKP